MTEALGAAGVILGLAAIIALAIIVANQFAVAYLRRRSHWG